VTPRRRVAILAMGTLLLTGSWGPHAADRPAGDDDRLSCAFPYALQLVRDLDFGRVVMARAQSGQVDVETDGAYRQLGGAFVGSPPAPAEFQFCGPADGHFELRVEFLQADRFDGIAVPGSSGLAAGSIRVDARGAELQRSSSSMWEGQIGAGGQVSVRVAGRLDVPASAGAARSTTRVLVTLRSK